MRMLGSMAAATLLLQAATAHAQTSFAVQRLPCHAYAEIARQLGTTYAEAPVSLGLQSNGNLLQVFSSAESGSWTIVSVAPDGSACVLAAGQHWETVMPVAHDEPA